MKISVLGTGMVGNVIGTKLIQLGHEVKMGSRTAGNEKAVNWVKAAGGTASAGTFAESAAFGEIVFNCTKGEASLEVLKLTGAQNLKGKVLIDVSNPLDFSRGMPPTLTVCNTDSIGEQIQKAYPDTFVVKSLNTINCNVMVNPSLVPGEHDVFVAGNNGEAKTKVKSLLGQFGWKNIVDAGDIGAARGLEMILPLWVRLMMTFGNPNFNFHIAR